MSDEEAQQDELLALASIFDESVFVASQEPDGTGGTFIAHPDLNTPFYIHQGNANVDLSTKPENKEDVTAKMYKIQHLPPITLHFQVTQDYPSKVPPSFTLSCKWLKLEQLSKLCKRLDEIWKEYEGEVVLFIWTSFLKDEALEFLNITSPLDISRVVSSRKARTKKSSSRKNSDEEKSEPSNNAVTYFSSVNGDNSSNKEGCELTNPSGGPAFSQEPDPEQTQTFDPRAVQDIASQELLLATILEHDKMRDELVFRTTLFTCQVCFLEKLGVLCIRFPGCEHVFCKECMKGFFEVMITEGNVKGLTCPDEKCESQAHPGQVKELVSAELFTRYDRLLLQSVLDTMSDMVYCPRKNCNCPVMVEQDIKVGHCPACRYVFCPICRFSYHGVSPCKIKRDDIKKLQQEYANADATQKKFLERRYGKAAILALINDSYTQEWLDQNSKQCPDCNTHIQKVDGCNKMTCTKCRAFFCWLCMEKLPRNNPYYHFNTPTSECFNMLFRGVANIDDDDDDDDDFDEEAFVWGL